MAWQDQIRRRDPRDVVFWILLAVVVATAFSVALLPLVWAMLST